MSMLKYKTIRHPPSLIKKIKVSQIKTAIFLVKKEGFIQTYQMEVTSFIILLPIKRMKLAKLIILGLQFKDLNPNHNSFVHRCNTLHMKIHYF